MGFIDTIFDKARKDRKTVVLPETGDRRVLEAAATVVAGGIADIVLVGNPDRIAEVGAGLDSGLNLFCAPDASDGGRLGACGSLQGGREVRARFEAGGGRVPCSARGCGDLE